MKYTTPDDMHRLIISPTKLKFKLAKHFNLKNPVQLITCVKTCFLAVDEIFSTQNNAIKCCIKPSQ